MKCAEKESRPLLNFVKSYLFPCFVSPLRPTAIRSLLGPLPCTAVLSVNLVLVQLGPVHSAGCRVGFPDGFPVLHLFPTFQFIKNPDALNLSTITTFQEYEVRIGGRVRILDLEVQLYLMMISLIMTSLKGVQRSFLHSSCA